jgi:hypothetical protein
MYPLHLQSNSGLADRLFKMAAYWAACRLTGNEGIVSWLPSKHCPGRFTDAFEPDARVTDTHTGGLVLQGGITAIRRMYAIVSEETDKSLEQFTESARRELRRVQLRADAAERMNGAGVSSDLIGVHVRRTDKLLYAPAADEKAAVYRADRDSLLLIARHVTPGARVYLACDDAEPLEMFAGFLKSIGANVTTGGWEYDTNGFRQTTLAAAAYDMWALSRCGLILKCGPGGFAELAAFMTGAKTETIEWRYKRNVRQE